MGIGYESGIIAFAWLALVMTLAPGADSIFVIRSSLRGGWQQGALAALGISLGTIVWGSLVGLGIAALLVRFPIAYTVIALLGGLYLCYLAYQTLRAATRAWTGQDTPTLGSEEQRAQGWGGTFSAGLVTNLLNPKIGVFYLSVIPGLFAGMPLSLWLGATLGGIHAVLGMIWLTALALLAGWARRYLLRARARAVLDAMCGVVLLAFGVFVLAQALLHLP